MILSATTPRPSDPVTDQIILGMSCPECKVAAGCSFDEQPPFINGSYLSKTVQCVVCKYVFSLTITLA